MVLRAPSGPVHDPPFPVTSLVRSGTALKAAFQVAAPLRAGGQNAGAEQGGRHRQSDAEGRRAAEEFTPAEAPEGRLPAEVLQVAVHDLCLSVRLSFAVQPAAVPTGLVSQSRSADTDPRRRRSVRSEEHTSELQSLMRISYAVFCLKKKNTNKCSEQHS